MINRKSEKRGTENGHSLDKNTIFRSKLSNLEQSSDSILVGSVTDMPAVKVFALNAALAIIFNFILQITAFLALIKLDMMRLEDNRYDIIYCMKSKEPKPSENKVSIGKIKLSTDEFLNKFKCKHFLPSTTHQF